MSSMNSANFLKSGVIQDSSTCMLPVVKYSV